VVLTYSLLDIAQMRWGLDSLINVVGLFILPLQPKQQHDLVARLPPRLRFVVSSKLVDVMSSSLQQLLLPQHKSLSRNNSNSVANQGTPPALVISIPTTPHEFKSVLSPSALKNSSVSGLTLGQVSAMSQGNVTFPENPSRLQSHLSSQSQDQSQLQPEEVSQQAVLLGPSPSSSHLPLSIQATPSALRQTLNQWQTAIIRHTKQHITKALSDSLTRMTQSVVPFPLPLSPSSHFRTQAKVIGFSAMAAVITHLLLSRSARRLGKQSIQLTLEIGLLLACIATLSTIILTKGFTKHVDVMEQSQPQSSSASHGLLLQIRRSSKWLVSSIIFAVWLFAIRRNQQHNRFILLKH